LRMSWTAGSLSGEATTSPGLTGHASGA